MGAVQCAGSLGPHWVILGWGQCHAQVPLGCNRMATISCTGSPAPAGPHWDASKPHTSPAPAVPSNRQDTNWVILGLEQCHTQVPISLSGPYWAVLGHRVQVPTPTLGVPEVPHLPPLTVPSPLAGHHGHRVLGTSAALQLGAPSAAVPSTGSHHLQPLLRLDPATRPLVTQRPGTGAPSTPRSPHPPPEVSPEGQLLGGEVVPQADGGSEALPGAQGGVGYPQQDLVV